MAEQFPTEPTTDGLDDVTGPATSVGHGRPWWQPYLPLAIVSCVLLAIGFVVVFLVADLIFSTPSTLGRDSSNPVATTPVNPSDNKTPANLDGRASTESNSVADAAKLAKLRADEERAIRSAKLEQFTTARAQTEKDLAHLALEMESWAKQLKNLLDGDGGQRIASDTTYIERFLPVYESNHISQEEFESYQRRFMTLSGPIATAEKTGKDSNYLPSESLLIDLRTLQEEVSLGIKSFEVSREDAESLQRFAASRSPSEKTLRTAIGEFLQQRQDARLERISEARRKAEEETTARLAREATEQEQLRRNVELARIAKEKAALSDEKRQLELAREAEDEKRREAAAKAALVRQFETEYPRMKSYLVAFTAKGTKQPIPHSPWKDTGKMEPVSFSAMQRAGLLEDTESGRGWLWRGASSLGHRNPGSFPDMRGGGPGTSVKIREIQQFLLKYGEVMVEKHYLSP